ncbi:MAG: hypothetical protein KatS3mg111_1554 [Pirellulaceae bacterium]|nr:MAG: hypothetical protein KatS3mg111_1554 [Pirellulaceae bacterium]
MVRMDWKKWIAGLLMAYPLLSAMSAERPTLNHHTRDPRPDILVHPLYDAHVEYRRRYNRPRFLGGWIAHKIAPSSQEAMVWDENMAAGRYRDPHAPPVYKLYMYPKPWEVLLADQYAASAARAAQAQQHLHHGPYESPGSMDQEPSILDVPLPADSEPVVPPPPTGGIHRPGQGLRLSGSALAN